MKQAKPPCATILQWLRYNKIPLGALTGHDVAALMASTQTAALWAKGDSENREKSAVAFANCVSQMQPHTQFIAYHAIAHCADWSHRSELWLEAGLTLPTNVPDCEFSPRERLAGAR